MVAHWRRASGAGQRERRAADPAVRGDREGPARAGGDVPRRHRGRATRARPRGEGKTRGAAAVLGLAARRSARPAFPAGAGAGFPTTTSRWSDDNSPSATPRKRSASCWRRWRRPAANRSVRWAPTPRSPSCRSGPGCSTTTSSTVRAGHQPAAGCDPGGDRDVAAPRDGPRAESARTHGRVVSADRAAVAGARQRRAGEDHRHQRGRGLPGFAATVLRALVPGGRGR